MLKTSSKFVLIRTLCLLTVVFLMTGCGQIDWFPQFVRAATTPDPFTFTTKTGVALNTAVTSNAITVSGITGSSSPISITGPVGSNSKYSINGGTATDVAGTVANGDKVTVTHTSGSAAGVSVTSTLTIGNINGTFTSITSRVQPPSFSAPVPVGGDFFQVAATISSVDDFNNPHIISIKDSQNTGNAQFAITDSAGIVSVAFRTAELSIPVLNGQRILVKNVTIFNGVPLTTTLTIDGVDFPITLTP